LTRSPEKSKEEGQGTFKTARGEPPGSL